MLEIQSSKIFVYCFEIIEQFTINNLLDSLSIIDFIVLICFYFLSFKCDSEVEPKTHDDELNRLRQFILYNRKPSTVAPKKIVNKR